MNTIALACVSSLLIPSTGIAVAILVTKIRLAHRRRRAIELSHRTDETRRTLDYIHHTLVEDACATRTNIYGDSDLEEWEREPYGGSNLAILAADLIRNSDGSDR